MSLVFPAADPHLNGPAIHALIIGVGEYPHLLGGSKFAAQPARYPLGLKQLTSPPVSAQALANWMIEKMTTSHHNPNAPLGTIELLLSPQAFKDATGNVRQVEAATFDNIRAAFERWKLRCDPHPENIAVFYYCGHGFEWASTYLLASDYGSSVANPWDNLIDFNSSRLGFLGDCQATTLCCYIDACREVSTDLIKQFPNQFQPRALWSASSPPSGDRDAPIFKAAAFGEQAHGLAGGISYFTQALLRCLGQLGAGGPPNGGKWEVSTNSLAQAMKQLMRRTLIPNVGNGTCEIDGQSNTPRPTVLHYLPDAAHALTEVSYNPPSALEFAEIECKGPNGVPAANRHPSAAVWQFEITAGMYNVGARFPNHEYPDRQVANQIIWPPFTRCTI